MHRSRSEPAPAPPPRRAHGPLAAALALLAPLALAGGLAAAQEAAPAEPAAQETAPEAVDANYMPYGRVTIGAYAPIEGHDAAAGAPHGALAVRVAVPTDQAPDVTITGPDGFVRTQEIGGAGGTLEGLSIGVVKSGLFEDLPPGTYVVAATDDGLEPAAGRIEIRPGEIAAMDVILQEVGGTLPGVASAAEFGSFWAARYHPMDEGAPETGAIRIIPLPVLAAGLEGAEAAEGEGGVATAEAGGAEEAGEAAEPVEGGGAEAEALELAGAIVGPDDERVIIEGETLFEGLPPGVYSVALTAEGREVVEIAVEVRLGQEVVIEATLPALAVATGGDPIEDDDAEEGGNPLQERIGGGEDEEGEGE